MAIIFSLFSKHAIFNHVQKRIENPKETSKFRQNVRDQNVDKFSEYFVNCFNNLHRKKDLNFA